MTYVCYELILTVLHYIYNKVGETKLAFKCTGLPVCLFSNSKIKMSQLEKRLVNFLKITLDLLSHFTILVDNK